MKYLLLAIAAIFIYYILKIFWWTPRHWKPGYVISHDELVQLIKWLEERKRLM